MKIERSGNEYYAPDEATTMQPDGAWSPIAHSALLPIDVKMMQDQVYGLTQEPLPSDEELLEFARMEHPVARQHQEADMIKQQIQAAWDAYSTQMVEAGLVLGDMPEYGGQG